MGRRGFESGGERVTSGTIVNGGECLGEVVLLEF